MVQKVNVDWVKVADYLAQRAMGIPDANAPGEPNWSTKLILGELSNALKVSLYAEEVAPPRLKPGPKPRSQQTVLDNEQVVS